MSAAIFDIIIEQNASWDVLVQLKDQSGDTINLQGYTGKGDIKRSVFDATVLDSFIVDFPDAEHGVLHIGLTSAQTSGFKCGKTIQSNASKYSYDVILINGENILRIIKGNLYVDVGITKNL